MYILEFVIVFLVVLLLYSTGWLVRIFQILLARLSDFGRAFLKDIIKEQIEDPEEKKKSKRS
jgi:hypothetical protein